MQTCLQSSCDAQTYRTHGSFLQLWFEATTHHKLQGQYQPWGGLWSADNAESFISNAVHMYTCETDWNLWQQRGLELLRDLYDHDTSLKVVQVADARR